MRTLLLILCALAVACGPDKRKPSYTPPSTHGVRSSVGAAKTSVAEGRAKVAGAKTSVAKAQAQGQTLFRLAPVDLQPMVLLLQAELKAADTELAEALTKADETQALLVEGDKRIASLETAINHQSELLTKESSEKNAALEELSAVTSSRNEYRLLLWKWRGYCLVLVLLVAGFFVARQYFPFLKVL